MSLKPFRIRNLYNGKHGVIQITARQYDSTLVSQPDAALTYLDDNDGETITVGSSFELGQRLEEPALHDSTDPADYSPSLEPMHIFDINYQPAVLAIWRDHEAYSSKLLRKNSGTSESAAMPTQPTPQRDLSMWTTDASGRPVYDRYVERNPEEYSKSPSQQVPYDSKQGFSMREDTPRSPIFNFETASVVSKNSSNPAAAQVSMPNYQTSQPVYPASFKGSENLRTAEEFGQHILRTAPPNFSLDSDDALGTVTSKEEKPNAEPATSTSRKAELEPIKLEHIVTSALQGLDTHLDGFAGFLQITSKALRDAAGKTRECDTTAVESIFDGFRGIIGEVGKMGKVMLETLDTEATAIAKEIAPLFGKDLTSRSGERQPETTAEVDNTLSQEVKKENLSAVSLPFCEADMINLDNLSTSRDIKKVRQPVDDYRASLNIESLVSVPEVLPSYRIMNDCPAAPLPLTHLKRVSDNGQEKHMPALPKHNLLTKPAPPMSNSILDLEASDPDFSVRYPPLMSLRRARTVAGLNSHSTIPPRAAPNAQTVLSRYPSIKQLEKTREKKPLPMRLVPRPHTTVEVADKVELLEKGDRTSWAPKEDPEKFANLERTSAQVHAVQTVNQPEMRKLEDADLLNSSITRQLPGAWPETVGDNKPESSGEFFDRMTRNRAVPAPITPVDVRPLNSYQPKYVNMRDVQRRPDPVSGLHRSHTVTATNPAARLTRPFDPMLPSMNQHPRSGMPLFPRDTDVPRRSNTDRGARHRPYFAEPYSAMQQHVPGSFTPQTPAPQVWSQQPAAPHLGPRPMRSTPQFNTGSRNWEATEPRQMIRPRNKVDECIEQLKNMGYGADDPMVESRLNVYAGATGGDVEEALEMIEEDRKGSWEAWMRKGAAKEGSGHDVWMGADGDFV